MSPPVTMYSTVWCGHCRRLKRQLDDSGIAYTEIDIDERTELGARIEAVTGGYRTVPTVAVGDRLLVNPSVTEVQEAMSGAGSAGPQKQTWRDS